MAGSSSPRPTNTKDASISTVARITTHLSNVGFRVLCSLSISRQFLGA
jgi:hypothetical protein